MNTKTLSRHYGTLTPAERLPLIVAATARGDDVERERLMRAAPTEGYRLPDYHGLADAVQLVSLWHAATLLDLAATFWRVSEHRTEADFDRSPEGKARRRRVNDVVRVIAYVLVVNLDAWKELCAELKIDPDVFLRLCPGFETIGQADTEARQAAFSAEEVRAWVRKTRGDGGAEIRTTETVLRDLREALDAHAQMWA